MGSTILGTGGGWGVGFGGDDSESFEHNKQVDQNKADFAQQAAKSSGWNLALGLLGDYLSGTGDDHRKYDNGSTQVKELLNSKDGKEMMQQMEAQGFKPGATGGVGSLDAAKNTASDFFMNGTESQLGAFDWRITGRSGSTVQVLVTNELTVNSFFYHADNMNYSRTPIDSPYGPIRVDEPMSTITQQFIFTVKAPH